MTSYRTVDDVKDCFHHAYNSPIPSIRRRVTQGINVPTKVRNELYLEDQQELLIEGQFRKIESRSLGGGVWKVWLASEEPAPFRITESDIGREVRTKEVRVGEVRYLYRNDNTMFPVLVVFRDPFNGVEIFRRRYRQDGKYLSESGCDKDITEFV